MELLSKLSRAPQATWSGLVLNEFRMTDAAREFRPITDELVTIVEPRCYVSRSRAAAPRKARVGNAAGFNIKLAAGAPIKPASKREQFSV